MRKVILIVVPRKGDVDRNFLIFIKHSRTIRSSPARGTWIEISATYTATAQPYVVPRKGDVDRNISFLKTSIATTVVPRKGDVDRNSADLKTSFITPVVPRKGDVDRNDAALDTLGSVGASSPARGTWIEILRGPGIQPCGTVVPRKGDVDRNMIGRSKLDSFGASSPARGTWIEIE